MRIFKWLKRKYKIYKIDKNIKRWKNCKSGKLKKHASQMIKNYEWLKDNL